MIIFLILHIMVFWSWSEKKLRFYKLGGGFRAKVKVVKFYNFFFNEYFPYLSRPFFGCRIKETETFFYMKAKQLPPISLVSDW